MIETKEHLSSIQNTEKFGNKLEIFEQVCLAFIVFTSAVAAGILFACCLGREFYLQVPLRAWAAALAAVLAVHCIFIIKAGSQSKTAKMLVLSASAAFILGNVAHLAFN